MQVRDADEAEANERVFFTPMLIVQDARDLDHRTVVVGDLRQPDVITTLLSDHGIVARQIDALVACRRVKGGGGYHGRD